VHSCRNNKNVISSKNIFLNEEQSKGKLSNDTFEMDIGRPILMTQVSTQRFPWYRDFRHLVDKRLLASFHIWNKVCRIFLLTRILADNLSRETSREAITTYLRGILLSWRFYLSAKSIIFYDGFSALVASSYLDPEEFSSSKNISILLSNQF